MEGSAWIVGFAEARAEEAAAGLGRHESDPSLLPKTLSILFFFSDEDDDEEYELGRDSRVSKLSRGNGDFGAGSERGKESKL